MAGLVVTGMTSARPSPVSARTSAGPCRPGSGTYVRAAPETTALSFGLLIPDLDEHVLKLGARRVAFVGVQNAAATVDAREAGYREALHAFEVPFERAFAHRLDPEDAASVRALLESCRPEAIVCANDWTAARIMRTLLELGHVLPRDVRLVGIDDVDYASLLPVPLTTLRQPTAQIGTAALAAMLDRVARVDFPTRDILLQGTLVVRKSCGTPGGG